LGCHLVDWRELPRAALTTGHRRRIPVGDNGIASTPNSRVAPGGGGPTRTRCMVRGVNRQDILA
jgi:hypothetical protein